MGGALTAAVVLPPLAGLAAAITARTVGAARAGATVRTGVTTGASGSAAPGGLRLVALGTAVAFVLAAAVTVTAFRAGPVTVGPAGTPLLTADRTGAVLLLLVCGVGAVVQAYAVRHLAGDPGRYRFAAVAGVLVGASAVLVTAGTLVTLAAAWTVAGVALCLLLASSAAPPYGRRALRRAVRAVAAGDAALWAAVLLVVARGGDVPLHGPAAADPSGTLAVVVALLIVAAALARSVQLPWHGWLPDAVAAPTPVSALLHAGVVNAGGVLLLRTQPWTAASAAATWLAVAAGAATALYGTAVMLTRPDVKGALAYSTVGQMGFLVLCCALGLTAAAVVHLVAHGCYKATLFLGSGSALRRHARAAAGGLPRPVPAPARRRTRAAAAVALPVAALAGAVALLPGPGPAADELALLGFAAAAAVAATRGWLARHPGPAGLLTAAGALALLAPGYVLAVHAAADALPGAGPAPGGAAAAVLAAVLLAAALPRLLPPDGTAHRALYARLLAAGQPHAAWRPATWRPAVPAVAVARPRPVAVNP